MCPLCAFTALPSLKVPIQFPLYLKLLLCKILAMGKIHDVLSSPTPLSNFFKYNTYRTSSSILSFFFDTFFKNHKFRHLFHLISFQKDRKVWTFQVKTIQDGDKDDQRHRCAIPILPGSNPAAYTCSLSGTTFEIDIAVRTCQCMAL
jgi:hypothetical protein